METNTKILLAILIVISLPITIPLLLIIVYACTIIFVLVISFIVDAIVAFAIQPVYCIITIVSTVLIMCAGYKTYRFLVMNG